jgi:GNAT superfamily N-acetyltransferase
MANLRVATPNDAPGIAKVYIDTWLSTYAGIIPDHILLAMSHDGETAAWRRSLARTDDGSVVIVAEDNAEGIVAFGSGGRARGTDLPYEGEVHTLYVTPDFQGRGLGRQLLGSLFSGLVSAGHRSGLIWVLAENPARFFYQAMGGSWVAVRNERFRGVSLAEMAFGWPDLNAAVAPTGPYAAG